AQRTPETRLLLRIGADVDAEDVNDPTVLMHSAAEVWKEYKSCWLRALTRWPKTRIAARRSTFFVNPTIPTQENEQRCWRSSSSGRGVWEVLGDSFVEYPAYVTY